MRESIKAITDGGEDAVLFVGSQGRGSLETVGVPIYRYWYRRSRFRPLTLLTYLASQYLIYRSLSKANLPANAVIYVNTLLPFGGAFWARRNDRVLIYHVHEVSISPRPLHRFLVWIVAKTAHRILYVSEDNRTRLSIAGVPNAVVPNPITSKIAAKGFATPYLPRRTGRFEVLMLASPRDFKGVPELIKLAHSVIMHPDVHFTLVLNADMAEVARYLTVDSLPENVDVFPRTDTPEAFYSKADVLLNLSRVDQVIETFGLTIVEGMAFGLPVIAPPVGGPSEIVTDGREGFLIDSRDGAELQRRLLALADDPETALAMSEAARRRAQDFTVERFADALRAQIKLLTISISNEKIPE